MDTIGKFFEALMSLGLSGIMIYAAGLATAHSVPFVMQLLSQGNFSTEIHSAIAVGVAIFYLGFWLLLLRKLIELWGFAFD